MPPDILAHFIGPLSALLVVATTVVLVLRGPLGRALARRIEGSASAESEAIQRVEDVEARVQAIESVQERVRELEERLDFAERLLARQRTADQLPEAR